MFGSNFGVGGPFFEQLVESHPERWRESLVLSHCYNDLGMANMQPILAWGWLFFFLLGFSNLNVFKSVGMWGGLRSCGQWYPHERRGSNWTQKCWRPNELPKFMVLFLSEKVDCCVQQEEEIAYHQEKVVSHPMKSPFFEDYSRLEQPSSKNRFPSSSHHSCDAPKIPDVSTLLPAPTGNRSF